LRHEENIVGENKRLHLKNKSFSFAIQSPLLTDLHPLSGLKFFCNLNIVYENLKSENSHDNAQRNLNEIVR
jgi:hypothetical protein